MAGWVSQSGRRGQIPFSSPGTSAAGSSIQRCAACSACRSGIPTVARKWCTSAMSRTVARSLTGHREAMTPIGPAARNAEARLSASS